MKIKSAQNVLKHQVSTSYFGKLILYVSEVNSTDFFFEKQKSFALTTLVLNFVNFYYFITKLNEGDIKGYKI